ncbi:SARP family transcriptional regulator (plasmid) [Deinococcus metallilatus]|uniref:Tetratricopeptide (TPR) repeat protein n=1 Tax=Deinococcus metallilatus TaxID=1211322 RepID=A0ABR6MV58_9DEIO|nr:SARP family transcriptional regulator [Deinococcus metallilatus]MBB5295819.1 tetratricopeptide (TPR) repeat protein [Deinococcus metallilatus]QBY06753.1 SARP family transcriptional regulator [Deinococcus metallilatus]GMA14346.1 hypothetical protein GCM10025871_06770 [Deinococcus metallilatus]
MWLGISLLRLGELHRAEPLLLRAHLAGLPEASVEYGNGLRALGRLSEAEAHFQRILSALSGELALRAQRWMGVTAFQLGRVEQGLEQVEQAWHGYLAAGYERTAANVMQTLARMYQQLNRGERATRLYQQALQQLPAGPNVLPRLSALQGLLDLQILLGQVREARATWEEARTLLTQTTSTRARAMLMGSEANLAWTTGDFPHYEALLEELWPLSLSVGDSQLRLWTGLRLADQRSRAGLHAAALELLAAARPEGGTGDPALPLARGVLARRRGDLTEAGRQLSEAVQGYSGRQQPAETTRALLHLAYAQYLGGDLIGSFATLRQALDGYLTLPIKAGFRREWEEMPALLTAAALEPALAPLLPGLLGARASGREVIRITTLGLAEVRRGHKLLPSLKARHVAVLVYLLLRPGHSRTQIEAALYPDLPPYRARNVVNGVLQELRTSLGEDVFSLNGSYHAPTYTVNEALPVTLDFLALRAAAEKAQLEEVLLIYSGGFLAELEGGDWLEARRAEALEVFRALMASSVKRAVGDWPRVLLLAQEWTARDPEDRRPYLARLQAAQGLRDPILVAQAEAALREFDGF